MRRNRHQPPAVDEENPYWISFSDIMSGLLVVFVLACLVLIMELVQTRAAVSAAIENLQYAEQIRRTLLEEAAAELRARDIPVQISDNYSVLRIPNELLGFDAGEADIQPRYYKTATEIGHVLNKVITKDERSRYLDTIFLEGHTDIRSFSGPKGNWGLSSYRAISLWEFWNQALAENERLDRLRNHMQQPLFSISGYAASRPIVSDQQNEDDYRRNRRIDIRFTVRRPELQAYQNVRRLLTE